MLVVDDARNDFVEFVRIPSFEISAKKLVTDEDVRHLELQILANPKSGSVIELTGGFRKLRFARPSRSEGKSGGTRVIYFFSEPRRRVYLILIYSKNVKDDLTGAEQRELRALARALQEDG
jgi:hypothetical protein